MPLYHAFIHTPPTITPEAHTIILTIYRQDPDDPDPYDSPVGELTFSKHPDETWAEAAARCRAAVQDFIANYEQRLRLNRQISTWLNEQEWTT